MEDHERANTREWDPTYKEPKKAPPTNEWQVVQSSEPRAPHKENTSPSKWHTAINSRQIPSQNQRRPPPRLQLESDNDGEAAWRARQPPIDIIRIPESLVAEDRYHEDLARQHGAFITSPHKQGKHGSREFGLWGEKEAVAAAKTALLAWIEEARSRDGAKSYLSAKFPKVVSLTPKLRERAERKWERDVARQRYRQHPPPGMMFGAIGTFHWPAQDYKPEEILGSSYEAFDPIRMDCSCYVVYNKERKTFRIMGKAKDVQTALQRVRKTCFQIAAKQINPVRLYLLRWTDGVTKPEQVTLVQYALPAIIAPEGKQGPKPVSSPRGIGTNLEEQSTEQTKVQMATRTKSLMRIIARNLKKLHYYKGSLHMRFRLGIFLTTQYRKTTDGLYELDEYESMIQESQFIGIVTQEIGEKAVEQALLPALQTAGELLMPSGATEHELKNVKPIYSVSFIFADEMGDLRLCLEWQEVEDDVTSQTHFEPVARKWTRLERDTGTPTALLDISLTDLTSGQAWQIDLVSSQAVDESRLPPQLVNFAHRVAIDPKAAKRQSAEGLFVTYNPYANLKSIQQRISWQYLLVNSDFTLELSRVQDRSYAVRGKTFTGATGPTIYEPRWSLNVFRKEWDTMFSQNERLAIGASADWKDDVETWFPHDVGPGSEDPDENDAAQGWRQLIEKLAKIDELVAKAKPVEEDLLLGAGCSADELYE